MSAQRSAFVMACSNRFSFGFRTRLVSSAVLQGGYLGFQLPAPHDLARRLIEHHLEHVVVSIHDARPVTMRLHPSRARLAHRARGLGIQAELTDRGCQRLTI